LRHGRQPEGIKAWTQKHREWINSHVHFDQPALEATLADYLEEMDHAAARFVKLEVALDEAAQRALSEIRAVLRGGNTSLARAAQPKTKARYPSSRGNRPKNHPITLTSDYALASDYAGLDGSIQIRR
jgi:hypothetical protein